MFDGLKFFINYSVIAGLVYSTLFAVLYFVGINPMGPASWLMVFISILLSYKGIKDYRDILLDGEISYGKAFRASITLGFFYASFSSLLIYFFGLTLASDLVEIQKQEVLKGLEMARQFFDKDDVFDEVLAEVDKMTIGRLAWAEFQNKLIGMAIIGLITAAILKKQKPLFDNPSANE